MLKAGIPVQPEEVEDMVWCSYCAKDQDAEADDINGFTCCTGCGRVLDDNIYSTDPTFSKSADGQSQVQGNFIRDRQYSSFRDSGGEGHAYATDSHEKTLEKGRNEIRDIADFLAMSAREDAVNAAHRLYIIAVERNFTRGRRTNQVAAACLYIICRQEQKPFLLIDFSDCLQTNVYVLGAVFLQLCRLLSLEQHPIMQKPVDPSLFIHRFTDRLLRKTTGHGKKFHSIANTALRLVASMKRDWMQTGRRPSGICGAALFISAHIHGFECTKTDVVSVVHICEGTLTRRLIEFEKTESGSLTAEEFEMRAKEFEFLSQAIEAPKTTCKGDDQREVLCEHKELGAAHFAVGLCKSCYEEFVRVSGGIDGGATPPAFQAAERKKMEAEKKKLQKQELLLDGDDHIKQNKGASGGEEVKRGRGRPKGQAKSQSKETVGKEAPLMRGQLSGTARVKGKRTPRKKKGADDAGMRSPTESEVAAQSGKENDVSSNQEMPQSIHPLMEWSQDRMEAECGKSASPHMNSEAEIGSERVFKHIEESDVDYRDNQRKMGHSFLDSDELKSGLDGLEQEFQVDELSGDGEETFSDIDDDEVDGYLHNQEEIRLKTIIWTEMNKEYLEEQQAKQEALAASQAAHAAALAAAGADSASAVELAAAAAAAVAELKKDRKRKRDEAKHKGPAESATEATRQMLQSKKLSSKVNYNALEKLFDGEDAAEATNRIDEKIKEDSKDTDEAKDKHVKWADSVVTNDLGGKQQDSKVAMDQTYAKAEGGLGKDEIEEDEDEDVDDDTVNIEDSNYGLPYGEDYGDDGDGYDEY